jgi:hypothetical protein
MQKEYKNAGGDSYFNASSDPMKDIMNIPSKGIGFSTTIVAPPTPAKSKKAFGDTGFGSWLSGVFDKDTTQNIINTGLGIYAYQKTGGTQGAPNPLNQGRADVQGQTPAPPADGQGSSSGLGTGGIVAISFGALALVGLAIYYATKN